MHEGPKVPANIETPANSVGRKLRILQVLEYKPPVWNGIARIACELELHLPGIISCEIKTIDVNSAPGHSKGKKKIRPILIVNGYPVLSKGLFRMRKHVEWADIIIVHEVASLSVYTALWSKLKKKTVILWRHVHVSKLVEVSIPDGPFVNLIVFLADLVQKIFSRIASFVIFSGSNPDCKSGEKYFQFPAALDYSKFNSIERGALYKKRIGINPDCFTFGYIGRLAMDKNLSLIYKVGSYFLRCIKNSIFICVGNGSIKPPDQLMNSNRFLWIPGTDTVQDIMKALDAVILLSETETGPLVIPESMACGAVPVCVPLGICASLIQHGINGFLIHSKNYNSIIDTCLKYLESLYKNRELTKEMSQRAAEDVKLVCPGWDQACHLFWRYFENFITRENPDYRN